MIAPEVLPFEIGNALMAMVKKATLETRTVKLVWDAVQAIPVELCRIDIPSALAVACRFSIYAYDAYFLECSLQSRSPLLTLDGRLQAVARDLNIQVLE